MECGVGVRPERGLVGGADSNTSSTQHSTSFSQRIGARYMCEYAGGFECMQVMCGTNVACLWSGVPLGPIGGSPSVGEVWPLRICASGVPGALSLPLYGATPLAHVSFKQ